MTNQWPSPKPERQPRAGTFVIGHWGFAMGHFACGWRVTPDSFDRMAWGVFDRMAWGVAPVSGRRRGCLLLRIVPTSLGSDSVATVFRDPGQAQAAKR